MNTASIPRAASADSAVVRRLSRLDRLLPVWIGQMAAGWLRQLAGDTVEVRSAGSAPAETVNPAGKSVESVRPIRDEIRTRVEKLLAELRR